MARSRSERSAIRIKAAAPVRADDLDRAVALAPLRRRLDRNGTHRCDVQTQARESDSRTASKQACQRTTRGERRVEEVDFSSDASEVRHERGRVRKGSGGMRSARA